MPADAAPGTVRPSSPEGPSPRAQAPASDRARRLLRALGGHWLFEAAFLAGAVLRGITLFAYQPALLVIRDSMGYLDNAITLTPPEIRPAGYSAFLRLLPLEGHLAVAPFVQHLLGLATAVILYVLLGRLGVRRWVAAAATMPLLLDPLLLNLEQHVLTEALFLFLTVACVALVLWRPRPTMVLAGAAGLLCGLAVLTRSGGLLIIVPLLLAVLLLRGGIKGAGALIALFLVPLVAYAFWFSSYHGTFGLTSTKGRFLYGRAAVMVDCDAIEMPASERQLCPAEPLGQRRPHEYYMWGGDESGSPHYSAVPPAGMTVDDLEARFAKRVFRAQPMDFAQAVAFDYVRGFAPVRSSLPGEPRIDKWLFHHHYPGQFKPRADLWIRRYGGAGGVADPQLTAFLVGYQRIVAIPGPVLAVALVGAVLAGLGIGRARHSGVRVAALLFAAVPAVYLLPAAVQGFSWRYMVVPIALLPCAGALAVTAFTSPRRAVDTAESPVAR